jgi:hypothetical protein
LTVRPNSCRMTQSPLNPDAEMLRALSADEMPLSTAQHTRASSLQSSWPISEGWASCVHTCLIILDSNGHQSSIRRFPRLRRRQQWCWARKEPGSQRQRMPLLPSMLYLIFPRTASRPVHFQEKTRRHPQHRRDSATARRNHAEDS